jgi:predicted AAA+ superfamily ATPase
MLVLAMYSRNLSRRLLEALSDTPVVLLHGARQSGKSTLARAIASGPHPARYISLDDATSLAAASADPQGFVRGLEGPVVVDEVQRAPGLFLAIKQAVDEDRVPGRFLLTGSANVLLLPQLAQTLVGRLEVLTLWPLSQGEIDGRREGLIDALFGEVPPFSPETAEPQTGVWPRIRRGGYPEALARPTADRRDAWFGAYVTTLLQRDIRDLASIEGLADLPRLLGLVAANAGNLVSFAELSRDAGIAQTTLKRYLALLETSFLVQRLPPWSANLGKRLIKTPKLYLGDTGLAAHLLGWGEDERSEEGRDAGRLLENFVFMELTKAINWSRVQPRLYHFRAASGSEVDFVLEDRSGRCVAIEVKAGTSLGEKDFSGLKALRDALGERFRCGVVLYAGSEPVPFGRGLFALPLQHLWTAHSTAIVSSRETAPEPGTNP